MDWQPKHAMLHSASHACVIPHALPHPILESSHLIPPSSAQALLHQVLASNAADTELALALRDALGLEAGGADDGREVSRFIPARDRIGAA